MNMKTRERSRLVAQMTFADQSRVKLIYGCTDDTWNAVFAILNGEVPPAVVSEYLERQTKEVAV